MRVHMGGRRKRRIEIGLAALMTAFLLASAIVVPVSADSFKPYDVTLPQNVISGQSFALTIRNDASTQQLGSVQIQVPSGYTIASAGQPASNIVTFQNLSLSYGGTATFTVTVTTPCGAGSAQWSPGFSAQQSNQWQSGNTANYMTLAMVTYSDNLGASYGNLTSKVAQPTMSYSNATCLYALSIRDTAGNAWTPKGGANNVKLGVTNLGNSGTLSTITIDMSSSSGYSIATTSGPLSTATLAVNASPGATVTLNLTINAPCATDLAWTFSTSPTFLLQSVNGTMFTNPAAVTTITTAEAQPACALAFLPTSGSPAPVANAQKSTPLHQGPQAGTNPVQVGVFGLADGQPVALSGLQVGVALNKNTAALSGTVSQPTSNAGVASFADLTVSASAPSYTLAASATDGTLAPYFQAGSSNKFDIVDSLQTCSSSSCTITPLTDTSGNSYGAQPNQTPTTTTYVSTSVGPSGLTLSCSSGTYGSYPDNPSSPAWITYTDPNAVLTGTLVISKADVNFNPNNGASFYQICFSAPYTFPTRAGTQSVADPTVTAYINNGKTWYTGVLPDCPKKYSSPCTLSRNKTGSGNVVVQFLFNGGDPVLH